MLKNTLLALFLIAITACDSNLVRLPIDPSAVEVRTAGDGVSVPAFDGTHWTLGTSTAELHYPCNVQVGDEIVEAIVYGERVAPDVGAGPFSQGNIQRLEIQSQLAFPIDVLVGAQPTTPPDVFTLIDIVLAEGHAVTSANTYSIVVQGNGIPGDRWAGAYLYVLR